MLNTDNITWPVGIDNGCKDDDLVSKMRHVMCINNDINSTMYTANNRNESKHLRKFKINPVANSGAF